MTTNPAHCVVTKTRHGFVFVPDWDSDPDDGIALPTKMEVCHRCGGKGVHDHPAFENGLTQEDFAEDPDFREDYFRGRYDVQCSECCGRNVVAVPDEDRMSPEQIAALHRYYRDESRNRAEEAAEARMGA